MSSVEKLSISIEPDLATWIRDAAEQQGVSVSAFVAEAMALQRQRQARLELADELGLPDATPEELDAIRAEQRAALADKS